MSETEKIPIEEVEADVKEDKEPFSENWSKIEGTKLVIKTYFFPTGQSKKIDIFSINGLYYEHQERLSGRMVTKGWGMSLSPCWWACDIKRSLRKSNSGYYNVVVDNGDSTMKGFTVHDMNAFLRKIRPMMNGQAVVQNKLPF